MYVYNPEGFDPTHHLPLRLRKYADCARVLVHLIESGRVFGKLRPYEFVPRKAAYLRNLVHKEQYLPLRDALAAGGVIELDSHYIVGQKSMGFRIGSAYEGQPFRRVRLQDDAAVRRLAKAREQFRPPLTDPTHQRLFHWLTQLEVDYEGAMQFLVTEKMDCRHFQAKQLAVEMIRDKEFFFVPDRQGRVHTNVTNLWKKLRSFLRMRGQPLVNIDIANSQPLLFALELVNRMTNETVNSNNHIEQSSFPSLSPSPFPFHYDAEGSSYTENIDTHDKLPADVKKYLELTQAGVFYEFMMGILAVPSEERKKFKGDFFGKVFYCKSTYYTKERRAFLDEFPTVFQHITSLKRDDPRNAPLALQRTESQFVIGTVCRRLVEEFPITPVLTIHDSILTTPYHAETALRVMREEFARLGIRPTLRVEDYRADQETQTDPSPKDFATDGSVDAAGPNARPGPHCPGFKLTRSLVRIEELPQSHHNQLK
jgi:hypothetical protein